MCGNPPHNENIAKQLSFYPKASLFENQMGESTHIGTLPGSRSVVISIARKLVRNANSQPYSRPSESETSAGGAQQSL